MAFINKTSAKVTASANHLTVNTPSDLVVGNFLLWTVSWLFDGIGILPQVLAPEGWFWIIDGTRVQTSSPQRRSNTFVFGRVVTGDEASTYDISLGASYYIIMCEMAQYDDVDAANPVYSQQGFIGDFFASPTTAFFFDQVGFEDILNTTATQQVIVMMQDGVLTDCSAPGGYNHQHNDSGSNSGSKLSLTIFDAPGYDAGLGDPVTITGADATDKYEGFRLFLRPPATATPQTYTWTVFDPFQVAPFTNWPFILKDSDNTSLYVIYPTSPSNGTTLEKYDLATRTLTLSVSLTADNKPVDDNCMTQDALHLYIALDDGALRRVLKADLSELAGFAAPFDCGYIMCPSFNDGILWSTEDCGEFVYQFDTNLLTHTTFDTGTDYAILSMTSDADGNGWLLAYTSDPFTKLVKVAPDFETTVYDVTADLLFTNNSETQSNAIIGFDPETGYLWAGIFNSEDFTLPVLSGMLVWDPLTEATINTFTYGKGMGVAQSSLANPPGVWDQTTRSRWVAYTYLAGLEGDLVFGTPGIADLVRFDENGMFLEKLAIENPPMAEGLLLEELQSAVISIQEESQDVWMILHSDTAVGECFKQLAVISEPLTPIPPVTPPLNAPYNGLYLLEHVDGLPVFAV